MKELVEKLISLKKTISTMESCTGGGLANEITNIEGASEILKFSAVTYSNEYKIKMGVDPNVIDKHSVYSMETAIEMSKKICKFTGSNYGIGITGKLGRIDKNNPSGENNKVFISIYAADDNSLYTYEINVDKMSRKENKEIVINYIVQKLLGVIK